MNELRKRIAVMLVIVVLALAACGGGAQEQAPAAEQSAAEPTAMMEEMEPTEVIEEMSLTEEPMEEPTEEAMEEPTAEPAEEMAPTEEAMDEQDMAEMDPLMLDGSAAGLRVALNRLLGEHVLLAASATSAALDGRAEDFEAAAAALDENSVDITSAISAVYGEDAGEEFLDQWRAHIGLFVGYTTATAAGDTEAKDQAVADLGEYITDFAAFLSGATGITSETLEANLQEHVMSLAAVVDAQAAGDDVAAYAALRMAYHHMASTAAALSGAISGQNPDMFSGDGASSAAELRVALNNLLAEHTFLAAMATDAALNGNTGEFEAAGAALDENSVALGAAITSVYGEDAGAAFLDQWRAHIGLFVDYTTATAAGDEDGKAAAVEGLGSYISDFAAFLAEATGLPVEVLETGLQEHVMGLAAAVDAQAADDATTAYHDLRAAYLHMQSLGDALSTAIVGQFPEMFPSEGTAGG